MSAAIDQVLRALDIQPVLVDVGASAGPPPVWQALAPRATYVGFDPDRRDAPAPAMGFRRTELVPAAVVAEEGRAETQVYLTRSPYCSSTLQPDQAALSDYLFAGLFAVEAESTAPAITLEAARTQLDLSAIDWLKLDTQGTDLRLFYSLRPETQARLLAVDVEPGLVPAYHAEDTFVAAHQALLAAGFWLSNLRIDGAVRLRPETVTALNAAGPVLDAEHVAHAVRRSPVYAEARYLRTLDGLADHGRPREYALLWAIALLDRQPGYALDLALAYERRFGADRVSAHLRSEPLRLLRRPNPRRLLQWARALVPGRLRRAIKQRLI